MQITIDTNNLSATDARVLAALADTIPTASKQTPAPAPASEPKRFTVEDFEAVPGVGDVTAQRIVEMLYGEAAEEPETDEADTPEASAPEEAPAPESDAESEDEAPTMSDAVAAATQLVSSGKAAQVKAALAEVGAKRVSEMGEGDIAAFMAALEV